MKRILVYVGLIILGAIFKDTIAKLPLINILFKNDKNPPIPITKENINNATIDLGIVQELNLKK